MIIWGGFYKLYLMVQHSVGRRVWPLELVFVFAPFFTYQCSTNGTELGFSHSHKAVTKLTPQVVLKIKKDNIYIENLIIFDAP